MQERWRPRSWSKLVGGRGRVLSFTDPTESHHFAMRHEGFQEALKCWPHLEETVFPNHRQSVAQEMVAAMAQADGVYVCSYDSIGVAQALDEAALNLPFVGFSNTEQTRHFLGRRIISAIHRPKPAIPRAAQLQDGGGILVQLRFRLGGEGSAWDFDLGKVNPGQSPHGHDFVYLTFGSAEQLRSRLGRSWWWGDPSSMPDLSARFHHRSWPPAQTGSRRRP